MLKDAKKGDKNSAIMAYEKLNSISKYFKSYKDVEGLKNDAYLLGQNKVLISIVNNSNGFCSEFYDKVMDINTLMT
ncbi:MAG: hypothetical protein R2771_16135 [Saprospiraceae bacterium]